MLVCLIKEAKDGVFLHNIYLAKDNLLVGEVAVSDELTFSDNVSFEMQILTVAHLMKIEERLVRTLSKRFTGEKLDAGAFVKWEYKRSAIHGCIRRWKQLSSWFNNMISEASDAQTEFVFSHLPVDTEVKEGQRLMSALILSSRDLDVELQDWVLNEK